MSYHNLKDYDNDEIDFDKYSEKKKNKIIKNTKILHNKIESGYILDVNQIIKYNKYKLLIESNIPTDTRSKFHNYLNIKFQKKKKEDERLYFKKKTERLIKQRKRERKQREERIKREKERIEKEQREQREREQREKEKKEREQRKLREEILPKKEEYFKVLNCQSRDPVELIKKKYKYLCLKYHPDKIGGTGEQMKKINQAYDIVKEYY